MSRDIEMNPGPTSTYVDPTKTITALYSHGNELVFGQYAGQQCVAMSLTVFFDLQPRTRNQFCQ